MNHTTKFTGVIATLIVLLSATVSYAQEGDSLLYNQSPYQTNRHFLSFTKQAGTFNFNNRLVTSVASEKLFIGVRESFNSSLIRSTTNILRDELRTDLLGIYTLSENIDIGVNGSGLFLNDNRSVIQLNSGSTAHGTVFTKIKPLPEGFATAFLGYTNDSQIGESDAGMHYGIEGFYGSSLSEKFQMMARGTFRNEDILPRRNLKRSLSIQGESILDEGISNSLYLNYESSKRDFYFVADPLTQSVFSITNNLQEREQAEYSLTNDFLYQSFLPNTHLKINAQLYQRSIMRLTRYKRISALSSSAYDNDINDLRFAITPTIMFRSENAEALLSFSFSEKNERYQLLYPEGLNRPIFDDLQETEAQKNSLARRLSLISEATLHVGEKHLLRYYFSQNKISYDTPSELNFDDRDELLTIIRLQYDWAANSFFTLSTMVEGGYSQQVYLFSELSSNNKTERTARLGIGGTYRYAQLKNSAWFDVSASYSVYDFEELVSNVKSYSLRQFQIIDTAFVPLSKRMTFAITGRVRITEQGSLNWNRFTVNPNRYIEEYFLHPRLIQHYERLQFSVGYRYFSINSFNLKNGVSGLQSAYKSSGPTADIDYSVDSVVQALLSTWYDSSERDNQSGIKSTNIFLLIDWNF